MTVYRENAILLRCYRCRYRNRGRKTKKALITIPTPKPTPSDSDAFLSDSFNNSNAKGKDRIMHSFTEAEKETITKEVIDQFNQLISALNQLNVGEWSTFYSADEFSSTIVGTDYYSTRSAWVNSKLFLDERTSAC